MTKRASAKLLALFVLASPLCFSDFGQSTDVTWRSDVNGGYGNWNDPGQWNPAVVPNNTETETYNVTFGGNIGATLATPVTVNRVDFGGGQINGSGTLTILDALNMNLVSQGLVYIDTVNLAPGSVSSWTAGDVTVNSQATVRNFGDFTVNSSFAISILLDLNATRTTPGFENESGGKFTMISAGSLTLNVPLRNSGLVDHLDGTINYQSGGLRSEGDYFLGSSATASGDLQFTGGSIHAAGTLDPYGSVVVSATAFTIGLNPNVVAAVNLNNKQMTFTGGSMEYKISSATSYDHINNLAGWGINGTTLSLRLIDNAQNTLKPSDVLTLANGNFDSGVNFGNILNGSRLTTSDGNGSFLVNFLNGDLTLTDFQAVPEPKHLISLTALAMGFYLSCRSRRLRSSGDQS